MKQTARKDQEACQAGVQLVAMADHQQQQQQVTTTGEAAVMGTTGTVLGEEDTIKVELVKQCDVQEPAAKKCKAATPHRLQQGDLQKIFLTTYKTSDYFKPMEAFPMVWPKDLAPKYISGKGQARIHACTYLGCSVQKPWDHQIWSHIAVEHTKTEAVCSFCTAEIGVQDMHSCCGFTSPTSMKEHIHEKHM